MAEISHSFDKNFEFLSFFDYRQLYVSLAYLDHIFQIQQMLEKFQNIKIRYCSIFLGEKYKIELCS